MTIIAAFLAALFLYMVAAWAMRYLVTHWEWPDAEAR